MKHVMVAHVIMSACGGRRSINISQILLEGLFAGLAALQHLQTVMAAVAR